MRAFKFLSVLALPLLTVGCAQDSKPATAIAVSIKSDYALGTELAAVEYRAVAVDGALDKPAASFRASADQLSQPYVLLQNEDEEVLIAVQGYGPANEPVVEYRTRARFVHGKTVRVEVALAKACGGVSCGDGQTCHGRDIYGTAIGACGPVPAPALTEITDGKVIPEWDAGPMVKDAGPGVQDGGCTTAGDAGLCDPVAQCGCTAGQICQTDFARAFCASPAPNPIPIDAKCERSLDCAAGLACGWGSCAKTCRTASDCGPGGSCYKDESTFGVCLKKCGSDSDCVEGGDCMEFSASETVAKGKYCAKADPAYTCSGQKVGNGVCDEAVVGGTGKCAPGTDALNCTCDVLSQLYCKSNQTCNPVHGTTHWIPTCINSGGVDIGGTCASLSNCKSGLLCIDSKCAPYCGTEERDTCATGTTCTSYTVDGTSFESIGACL